MKEVIDEGEGNIATAGDFLLPAHFEKVVLCALLGHHHGAGYHAGQVNPVMSCNQCHFMHFYVGIKLQKKNGGPPTLNITDEAKSYLPGWEKSKFNFYHHRSVAEGARRHQYTHWHIKNINWFAKFGCFRVPIVIKTVISPPIIIFRQIFVAVSPTCTQLTPEK